jgi:hypothetical protein
MLSRGGSMTTVLWIGIWLLLISRVVVALLPDDA